MTEEAQKRQLPAYLEYASDALANFNYRVMSLTERGLWDTMRKECWVNNRVPADPVILAKMLNLATIEVRQNLTPALLEFFELRGTFYHCPELENYKLGVLKNREKMSKGGAKGGHKTQRAIREAKASLEGELKGLNRDEMKRDEKKRITLGDRGIEEHKEWLEEFNGKGQYL
jgi:hypothetical protein